MPRAHLRKWAVLLCFFNRRVVNYYVLQAFSFVLFSLPFGLLSLFSCSASLYRIEAKQNIEKNIISFRLSSLAMLAVSSSSFRTYI